MRLWTRQPIFEADNKSVALPPIEGNRRSYLQIANDGLEVLQDLRRDVFDFWANLEHRLSYSQSEEPANPVSDIDVASGNQIGITPQAISEKVEWASLFWFPVWRKKNSSSSTVFGRDFGSVQTWTLNKQIIPRTIDPHISRLVRDCYKNCVRCFYSWVLRTYPKLLSSFSNTMGFVARKSVFSRHWVHELQTP